MESDSDSDASHISVTPPRNSIPSPPRSKIRVSSLPNFSFNSTPNPNPKPKSKRQSKSKSKPKPEPPPEQQFPSPDLSSLHGISVKKIQWPSDSNRTTSFSSLFKSRRPDFDLSEFKKDGVLEIPRKEVQKPVDDLTGSQAESRKIDINLIRGVEKLADEVTGTQPKSKKAPLNLIGSNLPLEGPERMKFSSEGNFVRLNINGYGRKPGFRNGKRKSSSAYTKYSRSGKFRRKLGKDKCESGNGAGKDGFIWEEDGLVMDNESLKQKGIGDCRLELVEEAVEKVRREASDQNLKKLLKLTHGYDSFREGQLEAIKKVVGGESTMLVLPTGAGKSLCYQLPALVLPGVTLVVSPLVALMVDQLRHLPPVITGALLCSTQTIEEASETLHRIREGIIKVLYVSPERFLNAEFLSLFRDPLSISLVVIDEAHCISEWSHNFRPSYLRLKASLLREKLNVQRFLAMTATATTQTLRDVMYSLEIQPTNLIQSCQIRENLQLFVSSSGNRLKDLLMLMKSSPIIDMQSIIVYCKFQAETDLVSKYLSDNNIPAKGYHGGILAKNRSRIQELFCLNKIRVVVATVAFGMGLDKSDVGAVIHYSLPESLEEYIQETGRAGRDGRLSYCHLFLDDTTYYKLRSLLHSDGVDEYGISKLLSHIFDDDLQLTGNICSLVKESASRKFDMKEEHRFNELRGFIRLPMHMVLLTVLTQLEMGDVQYLHLLPQLNVTCTVYFHKTSPALLADKDIIVATILKKSEAKDGHYVFDIPTIANDVGITATDLIKQLQRLKSLEETTYDLKDPAFCFRVVKKPDDFCSLTSHLTNWLSEVERCKVRKLDEMFNVANFAVKECKKDEGCSGSMHTICIQRKILDYFSRDNYASPENFSTTMTKTSPFMRADIKVFLQSNSHAKFTPRAIARIMHGIPSPAFPSATWSKCHFWGRYTNTDFPVVMEAASVELMEFVKKGGLHAT